MHSGAYRTMDRDRQACVIDYGECYMLHTKYKSFPTIVKRSSHNDTTSFHVKRLYVVILIAIILRAPLQSSKQCVRDELGVIICGHTEFTEG